MSKTLDCKVLAISMAFMIFDRISKALLKIPLLFWRGKACQKKRVLVVRNDHIGDFILWAGQLKFLRMAYPEREYELILFGNSEWTGLAKGLKIFDEIIEVNFKKIIRNPLYRFQINYLINIFNFDISIYPVYSREFLRGDSLISMSSSPVKIGFKGDLSNMPASVKFFADKFYSRLVIVDAGKKSELEINSLFTRGLGVEAMPALVELPVNPVNLSYFSKTQKYFIIFPGGSWAGKRWPPESFAKIVDSINGKYGFEGVICGSASERHLGDEINAFSNYQALNICGELTILELVEFIRSSTIIISNDTGPAHLGASLLVPTVCILGGGHYGRFFPYGDLATDNSLAVVANRMDCFGCNWRCNYVKSKFEVVPCISSIGINDVRRVVDNLLSWKKNDPI